MKQISIFYINQQFKKKNNYAKGFNILKLIINKLFCINDISYL